jgi:hypothetical protein
VQGVSREQTCCLLKTGAGDFEDKTSQSLCKGE